MANDVVESAYVEILPKVDQAEFNRVLNSTVRTVDQAGDRASQSLGRSFDRASVRVQRSLNDPRIARGLNQVAQQAQSSASRVSESFDHAADQIARDADRAGRAIDRGIREGADKAEKSLGGLKSAVGAVGGAIAAVGVGALFKSAVDSATELQDVTGALSVIVGDQAAKSIQQFSDTSADAFGISKVAALQASQTFATFGKSAGLVGGDLANFSTKFTALAGDLASFNGGSTQDAIDAIGSALRGEAEPIRRYGVLLDDATLKAEALRQGLIKNTTDALTPQQKVLASSALIFAKTRDAQGDAARTADSAANSQKRLSAVFEDIKTRIGTAVLPVITKLSQFLLSNLVPAFEATVAVFREKVIPVFESLSKTFQEKILPVLFQLYEAFKVVLEIGVQLFNIFQNSTALQSIAVAILAVVTALKVFAVYQKIVIALTKAQAAVQALLNTVMAANPIGLVVLALVAIAAAFVFAYKKSETFRNVILKVGAAVLKFVSTAIKVFKVWLTVVLSVYAGIAQGAAKAFGWLPGIGDKVKAAADGFTDLKDGIIKSVDAAANKVDGLSKSLDDATKPRTLVISVLAKQIGTQAASGQISLRAAERQAGVKNTQPEVPKIKLPPSTTGAIGNAAEKAGKAAEDKFKTAFTEVREFIAKELPKGFTEATPDIIKTFSDLNEKLKKAGKLATGDMKKRITDALKLIAAADNKILATARQRDAVTKLLDVAKERLAEIQKRALDFRNSIRDALISLGDVSAEQNRGASGVIARLKNAIDTATRFTAAITRLRQLGLDNTSLQQIIASGPERGLQVAQQLIAGGASAIKQIAALQKNLDKQAGVASQTITDGFYKAAVSSAQGFVDGLKKRQSAITSVLQAAASKLATYIRLTLNGKTVTAKFAKGGIFDQATVGMFGEAGREVILPLTRPRRTAELVRRSGLLDIPEVQQQFLGRVSPTVAAAPVIVKQGNTVNNTNHFTLVPQGDPYLHYRQIATRLGLAAAR